ncbi:MAG TPA: methionine-binding protein [Firmicutes bacterium]|nr:methionine-binding protein [Bacillota bacterium]
MKKQWLKGVSIFLAAAAIFTGCASGSSETSSDTTAASGTEETASTQQEDKDLKFGVCAGPYGDMITQAITPSLEEQGYTVEIVEFTDYVQPDQALASGDIDANLMQHQAYLDQFAADNHLDIVSVINVPTAGAGVFSHSITSLDELQDGDTVAIPIDAVNLARSLRFLRDLGVITLNGEIDETKASVADIAENPKNLEFVTMDAAQISRSLDSVAIGVVPGNYAIAAELDFADALGVEKLDEDIKNVIAVRTEDEDGLGQVLKDIVESEAFHDAIMADDSIFRDFDKPQWWVDKYGEDA